MGELIQYDFFETKEQTEAEYYRKKLEDLEASHHRVRRGTYAEINRLKADVNEIKEWRILMDANICKGNK